MLRRWEYARELLLMPCTQVTAAAALLVTYAALLAHSATQHSPTHLEPAFLAAGVSHWQLGRFELYRVNPPFPRMVAALPVLASGCKTDWTNYVDRPGSRAEFTVGQDFMRINGARSATLLIYARWAGILFAVVGGIAAYCWANDMYGEGAGLLSLLLWVLEPNLMAHAELVTPDCACWSLGVIAGYAYWSWLARPSTFTALLAGVALGMAQLTKLTWISLYAIWPIIWITTCYLERRSSLPECRANRHFGRSAVQMACILATSLYVTNCGYCFEGVGRPLGSFSFVSTLLATPDAGGSLGNRFSATAFAILPVPLPEQYVLGFDTQLRDFERFPVASYLRGEWKHGGWWYYYLYGMFVKLPVGLLVMCVGISVHRLIAWKSSRSKRCTDYPVVITVLAIVTVVSIPRSFALHLRYVFPAVALIVVFCGQWALIWRRVPEFASFHSAATVLCARLICVACIADMCMENAISYPNQLSYFNWASGGSRAGWRHLLGSSFDWGQDIVGVEAALKKSCHFATGPPFEVPVVTFEHFPNAALNSNLRIMPLSEAITSMMRQPDGTRVIVVFIDFAMHQYEGILQLTDAIRCACPDQSLGMPVVEQYGTFVVIQFPMPGSMHGESHDEE